jgi:tetratricopeptide (TPR) repeat protein
MKKQPSRRRAGSTAAPVRHQFDHVVPTVIHHPEEKMTALARWTHRVAKEPKRYVTWAVAIAAGIFLMFAAWNLVTGGRSTSTEVWAQLDTAKKADDFVTIANDYPKSPVSSWALLQAANSYFSDGIKDLPDNRDVALPAFEKAIKLYEQVARQAPKDSVQARAAEFGKARSLEARNELARAIEQYELIAKTWPGSAEGRQAKDLAAILQRPEATAFYKELYAFTRPKMTLPPLGSEKLELPPGGSATKFGTTVNLPGLSNLPLELALPNVELAEPGQSRAQGKRKQPGALTDLPADVFSSRPAPDQKKSPR